MWWIMVRTCQKSNTNIFPWKEQTERNRGNIAKTNSMRCVCITMWMSLIQLEGQPFSIEIDAWIIIINGNKFDICFCLHLRRSAATICSDARATNIKLTHTPSTTTIHTTTNAVIVANVSHFHGKHHAIKSRDVFYSWDANCEFAWTSKRMSTHATKGKKNWVWILAFFL